VEEPRLRHRELEKQVQRDSGSFGLDPRYTCEGQRKAPRRQRAAGRGGFLKEGCGRVR